MYTQQQKLRDKVYRVRAADERFMASLSPRERALIRIAAQDVQALADDDYAEYTVLSRARFALIGEAANNV